ncbi:MAG TPA: nucleotidyltransferase family protein [Polyangiales bacterium]|nr:nucleotidyltransferase family protein [Polyangiales bacterium]
MAVCVRAPDRIAGIVLAAGRSARMGRNKLLCDIDGAPLIAHATDAALGAGLQPVCVVTGHEPERVRGALAERDVSFAHNDDYAQGLAGSLRAGLDALNALGSQHAAVVVLLGDMPRVRAAHVQLLIAAFIESGANAICVPEHQGRRGNPVLWPACDLAALRAQSGDVGGRALLQTHADRVRRVAMPDDGVLIDVDSPAMLSALTAVPADRDQSVDTPGAARERAQ